MLHGAGCQEKAWVGQGQGRGKVAAPLALAREEWTGKGPKMADHCPGSSEWWVIDTDQ